MTYHIKFLRHFMWTLIVEGVAAIIIGALIFIYPDLLGMLVGILLVLSGVLAFVMAAKVGKYSKIEFPKQ